MPLLSKGRLTIDYTAAGQGEPVVLIHSSVSANRPAAHGAVTASTIESAPSPAEPSGFTAPKS